jgi:hypothetical protein
VSTSGLPGAWRSRAADLEPYATSAAEAFRVAADELEEALRVAEDEELTLSEAAAASGYSERRLREMLADETLPQAGRKGRPRIRRADLPRKPQASGGGSYDVDADADSLVGRMT